METNTVYEINIMRFENFIFLLGFLKFFLCIEFIQRIIRKDDFAVVFFTLKNT